MNLFFPSAPLDMEIREIAKIKIFLLQLAVEDDYAIFEEVQRHPHLLHRLNTPPGLRHRLVFVYPAHDEHRLLPHLRQA